MHFGIRSFPLTPALSLSQSVRLFTQSQKNLFLVATNDLFHFIFRMFDSTEKYQAISKMFSRINALCYLVAFIFFVLSSSSTGKKIKRKKNPNENDCGLYVCFICFSIFILNFILFFCFVQRMKWKRKKIWLRNKNKY